MVEAKDAAKHPIMGRMSPQNKASSSQVSSAEKPYAEAEVKVPGKCTGAGGRAGGAETPWD